MRPEKGDVAPFEDKFRCRHKFAHVQWMEKRSVGLCACMQRQQGDKWDKEVKSWGTAASSQGAATFHVSMLVVC